MNAWKMFVALIILGVICRNATVFPAEHSFAEANQPATAQETDPMPTWRDSAYRLSHLLDSRFDQLRYGLKQRLGYDDPVQVVAYSGCDYSVS